LNGLLYDDRLLVDGFDKNLSIWPVEDWPGFTRNRSDVRLWYGNYFDRSGLASAVEHVRGEVAARGPLCSADFVAREKVDWPWGPTNAVRAALESLYFAGELVVHHKAGTRKYYDLASRHISPEILSSPDPRPEDADFLRWRVCRRVGAIGLLWDRAGDAWLGIPGLKSAERAEAFASLLAEGDLVSLEVEGIAYPFHIRREDLPDPENLDDDEPKAPRMAFIAPLDNLIWDRKLVKALFDFEYKWEVYTPGPQRKYGWYVLPVLYGDRFVARVEPKLNKKTKTLELMNWWWEDGMKPESEMKKAFRQCIKEFMGYLGAKDISYGEEYKGPRI
jgi:uncharacterized protein